jgi:hypothetical protein
MNLKLLRPEQSKLPRYLAEPISRICRINRKNPNVTYGQIQQAKTVSIPPLPFAPPINRFSDGLETKPITSRQFFAISWLPVNHWLAPPSLDRIQTHRNPKGLVIPTF